jgi:hypothetical protein
VTLTGLAFDLGGSIDLPVRPDELGAAYLDEPHTSIAPLDRRAMTVQFFVLDLCVLTVELSGARADV